jgi:protein-S-isoprenylcysteine O-methyltransferase Ste14
MVAWRAGLLLLGLWFLVDYCLLSRRFVPREIPRASVSCWVLMIANMAGVTLASWAAFRHWAPDMESQALPALLLMLTGIALRFASISQLGRFHTSTLVVLPGQTVVVRGLYRWIRHPSYLGILIILAGFGLTLGSWTGVLILFGFSIPAYAFRIQQEEKMLVAYFGQIYREYQARTARLIPLIY